MKIEVQDGDWLPRNVKVTVISRGRKIGYFTYHNPACNGTYDCEHCVDSAEAERELNIKEEVEL